MAKRKTVVRIRGFNPYYGLYPLRRVVSRDAVLVAKRVRQQGFDVLFEPDPSARRYGIEPRQSYYVRKGVVELLSEPLVIAIVGPLVVEAAKAVTKAVRDHFAREREAKALTEIPSPERVILELHENGVLKRVDYTGSPISDERFREIMSACRERRDQYTACRAEPARSPEFRAPIFFEHSPKIVGWAVLEVSPEHGIIVNPAHIHDDETWALIQAGKLAGYSIAAIVRKSKCSVCGGDFVTCEHITGETYEGQTCQCTLEKLELTDISIVRDPVNRSAKLILPGDPNFVLKKKG